LLRMGEIAARTVIERIEQRGNYRPEIAIEPEFVVRESSGPAPRRPLPAADTTDRPRISS
jgi:DNA-binding LacI/PurR family transcriptional regulator